MVLFYNFKSNKKHREYIEEASKENTNANHENIVIYCIFEEKIPPT